MLNNSGAIIANPMGEARSFKYPKNPPMSHTGVRTCKILQDMIVSPGIRGPVLLFRV